MAVPTRGPKPVWRCRHVPAAAAAARLPRAGLTRGLAAPNAGFTFACAHRAPSPPARTVGRRLLAAVQTVATAPDARWRRPGLALQLRGRGPAELLSRPRLTAACPSDPICTSRAFCACTALFSPLPSVSIHAYDTLLSYTELPRGRPGTTEANLRMSAFSRNLCSAASRTLRPRAALGCRAVRPIALRAASSTPLSARAAVSAPFSTMSSLKSAAPPVTGPREYDPEIKDVASYVHNTPIDSELAVRPLTPLPPRAANVRRM